MYLLAYLYIPISISVPIPVPIPLETSAPTVTWGLWALLLHRRDLRSNTVKMDMAMTMVMVVVIVVVAMVVVVVVVAVVTVLYQHRCLLVTSRNRRLKPVPVNLSYDRVLNRIRVLLDSSILGPYVSQPKSYLGCNWDLNAIHE